MADPGIRVGSRLGFIFWFLPKEAILQGFTRLSWPLFLSVLGAFLLCHVATASKWWLLMDRAVSFPVALRAHFAGLAANLCLPGAAGRCSARGAGPCGAARRAEGGRRRRRGRPDDRPCRAGLPDADRLHAAARGG
ncbi:MAG: hypothetical protein R3D46_17735 [Defluviimonas denitrificans]